MNEKNKQTQTGAAIKTYSTFKCMIYLLTY